MLFPVYENFWVRFTTTTNNIRKPLLIRRTLTLRMLSLGMLALRRLILRMLTLRRLILRMLILRRLMLWRDWQQPNSTFDET